MSYGYYLDGGSIGLEIVDRDGERLQLAIPISDGPGDNRTYHRLFLEATHASFTNVVEGDFTQDTRRFVSELISEQSTPGPDRDCALIALRGTPRDYVEVLGSALWTRITR